MEHLAGRTFSIKSKGFTVLFSDRSWTRGRHRRPHSTAELRKAAVGGIQEGLAKLVDHDAPLLLAVALICLGFMFMLLGGFFWFFRSDQGSTFLFTSAGIVSWIAGCGVFIVFPPSSSPRHAKGR